MEKDPEPQRDPQGPSSTAPPADAPGAGDGAEREKAVGEGGDKDKDKEEKEDREKEKEEEEAFLVSLYKFMKERRTPIERIPHLGFKQINLWKIYKAVEKLGAYELVTGRRLWKNVYDELGGSPGSTSAATCTRRHYERLVLPYVRHLKGEEDKPLPPSKPRRQYKVSKDDRSKRSRKEKGREQLAPDKAQPEAEEAAEPARGTDGRSSPASPAPNPSGGSPSPCRTHGETYKRLFSSFYSKGNHPIMSPLAKKKLLAQVSKAESSHCHKRHCPEGRRAPSDTGPEPPPSGQSLPEPPEPSGTPSGGKEAAPARSASPGGGDTQGTPVFTGYFHAYRSEGLQPGCPPLWGDFSSLKDFLEPPSTFPGRPEEPEQPQEARGRAGRPWQSRAAVRGCWVPPGSGRQDEEEDEDEDEEDEESFGPAAESRSASPLAKEGRDRRIRSPGGHRGLPKPRAVVAAPALRGSALRFPSGFGTPLEPPKTRGAPLLIPAFPSPLVAPFPASFGNSFPAFPAFPRR
ncbi:PREDICTED: AT-rich interactive domain-containing protein 5A isoform X2 [Pseudopodoces humilis]|uniref:AT-rich interactive domain-containing protein 5A isoform X2 n=1 Tax=Pseudopodoces humilis TaxID=181119 RepID=UPI0006B7A02D|nr:PREDICTED: AT-rich interactive domain-containing protein 5A isoform X2 [Pseudopodoces humilis]